MSKILRILTAAAVLAFGLPQVASAALVAKTIDFEGIADGTDLTGAGNPYNDAAHGFTTFSGSAAALDTVTAGGNPTTAAWAPCPPAPADCVGANATLTVTIGQLFHGDGLLVGLTLNVGNSDALNFTIFDAAGGILKSGGFTPPTGGPFRPNPVFIAFNGVAKSISFAGAAAGFMIDNLSFSVDATTQPPGVPEPSSVALVALASAGAAAVRRRKA